MRSNVRDLVAYRQSRRLADDLHAAIPRWRALDRYGVGVQLLRSVDSIGANIAEASGRWHGADKRRFLIIARGSLYETEHWLSCAHARGLLEAATLERLDEIAKALSGLIRQPAPA